MLALVEPPFEPAGEATLKFWTRKMAFLLAITSAAQVSELQALDSNPNLCLVNQQRASRCSVQNRECQILEQADPSEVILS